MQLSRLRWLGRVASAENTSTVPCFSFLHRSKTSRRSIYKIETFIMHRQLRWSICLPSLWLATERSRGYLTGGDQGYSRESWKVAIKLPLLIRSEWLKGCLFVRFDCVPRVGYQAFPSFPVPVNGGQWGLPYCVSGVNPLWNMCIFKENLAFSWCHVKFQVNGFYYKSYLLAF